VTTGDGSLAPEVLPEGDTNATGDTVASTGLAGGAFPSTVATNDDVAVEEPRVILGHPTLRAPRDVFLDEAMGTAHMALTQAQNVLHWESGGIIDERRRLLLWASKLKEPIMAERARAKAKQ
jgi:hypothetical protein